MSSRSEAKSGPTARGRRRPFLVASITATVVVAALILVWAGANAGDRTWGDLFGMSVVASAVLALLGSTIRPLRPIMFGFAIGTACGFALAFVLVVIAIMRLGDV